jgi:aryl-alcohol dehydrogenase
VVVGDHVVMSYASCGQCPHCAIGRPAYCYDHGAINFGGTHVDGTTSHTTAAAATTNTTAATPTATAAAESEKIYGSFFRQSSFATHALCTQNNVLKIADKTLRLDLLAPLGCGIQTGAGAVMNTLQAQAGESLAVFGCGTVGLSAVMAAKVQNCSHIVAVDLNASRLSLAAELGATHTLLLTGKEEQGEIAEKIQKMTGGGVHYALDTSGNKHALRAAFDAMRPLGK